MLEMEPLDRYLAADPFTEFDCKPAIHSRVRFVAHLPEYKRRFTVRKDIDHGRLVHPDDQNLPQNVIEGGLAGRIFEVGDNNSILRAKSKRVALVIEVGEKYSAEKHRSDCNRTEHP